jgi:hypothetical protein
MTLGIGMKNKSPIKSGLGRKPQKTDPFPPKLFFLIFVWLKYFNESMKFIV